MPETHLEAPRGPLTQKIENHTAKAEAALIREAFGLYGHVEAHKENRQGIAAPDGQ